MYRAFNKTAISLNKMYVKPLCRINVRTYKQYNERKYKHHDDDFVKLGKSGMIGYGTGALVWGVFILGGCLYDYAKRRRRY
jgi:hypothetical protein